MFRILKLRRRVIPRGLLLLAQPSHDKSCCFSQPSNEVKAEVRNYFDALASATGNMRYAEQTTAG